LASSAQIKPFPFERVFMEPCARAPRNDAALEARIAALEADLERERTEHDAALAVARAEAHQQGLDQSRAERQAATLAAVDALQASIEAIEENFAQIEERLAREAGELALAAADLLAAKALEIDTTGAIDAAIGRALSQVRRGEPIQIRVHPDIAADVEQIVTDRQANDRRRLSLNVSADATLAPGDARLIWDQGGLQLDAEQRRQAVRAELDGLLLSMQGDA
jgi:flagellar assembly protein FliH